MQGRVNFRVTTSELGEGEIATGPRHIVRVLHRTATRHMIPHGPSNRLRLYGVVQAGTRQFTLLLIFNVSTDEQSPVVILLCKVPSSLLQQAHVFPVV